MLRTADKCLAVRLGVMPKQNKAQHTGRLGERWFAQQLPADWIFQPPHEDIGVDGVVVICEDSPSNGLEFRVQIKSSTKWKFSEEEILLRVKRSNLNYWLTGFNPTLIALYDTTNKIGWCSWINQIVFDDISILEGNSKTITLRIPTSQKLNDSTWDKLSRQLYSLNKSIAKRVVVSHMALPVLEATHSLMQSLCLIDLCAFNWPEDLKDFSNKLDTNDLNARIDNGKIRDLVDAETTAHKEIVQTLLELDRKLNEAHIPSTGVKCAAQKYSDICAEFIDNFHRYIEVDTGVQIHVNVQAMFEYRNKAVREVTQIVGRLSSLSLSIARENKAVEGE